MTTGPSRGRRRGILATSMLLKGCQDRASLSKGDSDSVECRIGLSVCRDEMMDEIEVRPMDNNSMRDPLKGVKQYE